MLNDGHGSLGVFADTNQYLFAADPIAGQNVLAVQLGNDLVVLQATAQHNFTEVLRRGFPDGYFYVQTVADLDQDGDLDLAVNDNSGVRIFARGPGGAFSELASGRSFHFADWNRDGVSDLMIVLSNSLQILGQQNDGNYVEVSRTTIPVDAYVESVSDLEGDGDPDVIVRESNGVRWRILLNAGDAHLAEFARVTSYRTTDLDFDGQAELMVVISGKLIVHRVDDKRQFQKISETSVRSGQFLDTVADLDGDGDLDILLRNTNDYNRVQIMLGSGDGSFHELASGTYPYFADWNADSNTDLLILNGSELKVLFGDGHGNFSAALVTTVVSPASLELSSDLDADGDPDVVLRGANDGIAHILHQFG